MSKLPAKLNLVALPFVLSMMMSFVISGVSTWRALSIDQPMMATWLPSWLVSWAIAFPTVLLVLPLSRKIVAALVAPPGPPAK